jgi:phosphoglycerate kinase
MAGTRSDQVGQGPRRAGETAVKQYLTIDDVEVDGVSVLVRSDLNVPIEDGRVTDDYRIRAALPTLETLVHRGATVTVCSHLGRPKGADSALSLRPVADLMAGLTDLEVRFGSGGSAGITVIENTRFLSGETSNDSFAANQLAAGHDLFVEDAFGSVHRAHASTVGVAEVLPAYAGLLLENELAMLGRLLGDVQHPFVLVIGGAKVADKLGVLANLGGRAETVLVGGKMAEELRVENPLEFDVELPLDIVAAEAFDANAVAEVVAVDDVPEGWLGLDIGRETRVRYGDLIRAAHTVFWNGPMGVFEWPRFAEGTKAVAEAVAAVEGFSVVGGGDSVRALSELGLAGEVTWVSTGGGASLELLEGKQLPGVTVIPEATA